LLACLMLSSCATTGVQTPEIPRPQPLEAMEPCQPMLCKLRPEIVNLEFADQMALLLGCKEADAEAYRKCEVKQKALSDWIRRGTTSLVHRRRVWRV
jgi:hypothetical protein